MHNPRLFPLLSSLMLAVPGISGASDVIVGPTNKAGFQAALDGANPGDRIVCLGGVYDFCDLGAVLITQGVRIVAFDSNDPPILRGLLDGVNYQSDAALQAMGLLPPGPTNLTGNSAFAVPPGAMADGLEIEGLHFEGFDRTINTLVGFDLGSCTVLAQPGSLNDLVLRDNHISNCGTGMQIIGGPLEDFVIKNNFIDCTTGNGSPALNVQGDYAFCGPPFANVPRLVDGLVKGNVIHGGPGAPAVNVAGVEGIQVKDNAVYSNTTPGPPLPGLLIRDFKSRTDGPWAGADPPFGDDGPIEMGQIKNNVIYDAGFGIVCQASTTMENVEIKANTMVNTTLFDIFLTGNGPAVTGTNGFTVKDNTFSGTANVAEVNLGGTTFNNVIKVPALTRVSGDLTNNTVIFE